MPPMVILDCRALARELCFEDLSLTLGCEMAPDPMDKALATIPARPAMSTKWLYLMSPLRPRIQCRRSNRARH